MPLQIEQFIESIFPTQDPKKIALAQAQNSNQAAANTTDNGDTTFLVLSMIGVLFVMGGLMVGISVRHHNLRVVGLLVHMLTAV